jgi:hypothetical protein
VLTLFSLRLSAPLQEWWYSKQPHSMEPENIAPPVVPVDRRP